jgi:hypothetical protein
MTAPTAVTTGTPSVAVSIEFPPHRSDRIATPTRSGSTGVTYASLASAPRPARCAIVPACALLPGVFKQAVHSLAH